MQLTKEQIDMFRSMFKTRADYIDPGYEKHVQGATRVILDVCNLLNVRMLDVSLLCDKESHE